MHEVKWWKTPALVALAVIGIVIATGCQTRITATKYAERAVPYVVTQSDGTTATNGYQVLSGGWYVTARSPLWADEAIRGLDVGTEADGSVHLKIEDYSRDLSTNSVSMVREVFIGSTNLVTAVGLAYSRIAGGASADIATATGSKLVNYFKSLGGDEAKAVVTCSDGTCTISDGTVSASCSEDGTCAPN